MKLGMVTEFDAAHSLPGYQGKCANLHGHTYQVEMVVGGRCGQRTASSWISIKLKKILAAVLQDLDHNCLNEILPNPTAETIAQWISERLKKEMETTSVRLFSLKLWEGKNKWVMID